ncbi:MAG: hypothetical protein LBH43_13860 [Treponema sp.]|jgi:hypothetical protein|nr:hypothetical protein [Treponema sp.]
MAQVNFSYPIPPKSIGGCLIDAFVSERYSYSNSVTDVPLEDGSVASDHVVENPFELHISGFIGKVEFAAMGGGGVRSGPYGGDNPKARISEKYNEFLKLKSDRQPIDVVTGLDTYTNMVITSFEMERDFSSGFDMPFEMTLKQIKIVKSETTIITASTPSGDQIAGTADMGVAGTSKLDPESSRMKEVWRAMYLESNGREPTREEYFDWWGENP